MPKVTVCIIARNQPHLVIDAAQSVFAQTFRDFNIVFVDDASDDGLTSGVLSQLGVEAPVPALAIHRATQGGPGAARNSGYRWSMAEFILGVDGDDLIEPTYLETTVAAIGDAAVCFTDYREFGDQEGVVKCGPWGPGLLEKNRIAVCSLIRRSAFHAVGGYDESIPFIEDYDLWRMLYAKGFDAVHVPEPLFLYRRHAEQWTAHQRGRPEAEARLRKKWETPLEYERGENHG